MRIKAAVRLRDNLACGRCRLTECEHLERYGKTLDVHRTTPGSHYSIAPGVCETLCRRCHRKAHRREPTASLRLSRSVARRVRLVALHLGLSVRDYFLSLLADTIARDEKKMVEELNEEQADQGGDES